MVLKNLAKWLKKTEPCRFYMLEQLLLLCLEEMKTDPQRSYDQALEHIGLPPHTANFEDVARNARAYASLSDATRTKLVQFYHEHNERLFEFLGRRLPWQQPGCDGGTSIFTADEAKTEDKE